jgi:LuxR family maltose regulon positive regulatory protein
MSAPPRPATALRHAPPQLDRPVVPRARLLQVLRGRFDRRVTVITAGAGFGKTTLLAQAVQENALERFGTDIWLRLDEQDRDPERLLVGLLRSLTGEPARSAVSVPDLCERIWGRSPDAVAILLDDTERIGGDGSPAWRTIAELLDHLPDNAHVVLAGRVPPPIGIRRGDPTAAATTLTEVDLAFDDDELRLFERALIHAGAALPVHGRMPRWPALAALMATLGHAASIDYLRAELVASLDPERRRLLALATAFDEIDDVLLGALGQSDGWTVDRLVASLPLVERGERGDARLHALFTEALADVVSDAERADAMRRSADILRNRGHWHRAAQASMRANDFVGVGAAVRGFCTQPLLTVPVSAVLELQAILSNGDGTGPMGLMLDGIRHWATNERLAATLFDRAARAAQQVGDDDLETLALWRGLQLDYIHDHDAIRTDARIAELAASGPPLALATAAFGRSLIAQREGRIADALEALDDFVHFEPAQRQVAINERLVDLGRPEAISSTLESVLAPGRIDFFGAQALWLRGEVEPGLAWTLADDIVSSALRRGVTHEQVSVLTVVATVGLAAGELDAATRLVEDARARVQAVGDQVRLLVDVAEAVVMLHHDDDERPTVELLERALAGVPIGQWPSRGHLHGLATIRALVPATAGVLDACPLGPSLRVAVDAGAAIHALRGDGDLAPAARLPWHLADLLRVHVPGPLLAELALAATVTGNATATRVLEQLPHRARWLQRAARRGGAAGALAQRMLEDLPASPGYRLSVRLLGDVEVARDDGRPLDDVWHRRKRVQDLFAFVVAKRRTTRAAAAQALWPSLPEAKASANLRVNLAHLHTALEPTRKANDRTWFVHADATFLRLGEAGIEVDVDRFDQLITDARRAEVDGMPSVALGHYAEAMTVYRGDYLAHLDDEWVWPERLRLRSLAHAATCRYGELVLARGEPEHAMSAAVRAQDLEPAGERAHRLFIRCHLSLGSLSTAREAGRVLAERLRRDGLTPEEETRQLLDRLDGRR